MTLVEFERWISLLHKDITSTGEINECCRLTDMARATFVSKNKTILGQAEGKAEFSKLEDAKKFASEKVMEGWVTHWYPSPMYLDKWTVHWWCQ